MFNAAWIYVGTVYAAAVWLARRSGVDLPRRVAALFYLLVLFFLFKPLTGPWVSFATDILELVPPWSVGSHLTKFTVSNPQLPDVTMQMVPWAHQVREAWRSGHLPLWNALAACGMPLAGNGQSSAFSPFRVLALPLPLGYAITAEAAMKLLTALTFTFLFCRQRGMSYAASIISAASYGFSLFMVVWLHFTQATVAAFLPAVFYGIDMLAEKVTARRFAVVAILWTASLLGGHPETSAHIALFAALYALWVIPLPRVGEGNVKLRSLIAIGGAAATTAVLASPLLIAIGQAVVRSMRLNLLRVRPYGAVPWADLPSLFVLLQPRIYGSFPKDQWATYTHAESISGFAGILGFASLIGLAAALLLRRVAWRSRDTFFGIGWTLALLLVANVEPISRLARLILPDSADARYRLLLCWFAALLAGVFVDRIREERTRAPFLVGLACAALALAGTFFYIGFPDHAKLRFAILTSLPALAVLVLGFCVAAAAPGRRVAIPLLTIAVAFEILIPGRAWNPVMPVSPMYPETPLVKEVRWRAGHERFIGIGGTLFPNVHALFGLEDVRVLDALALDRYMGVLRVTTDYDTSEYYVKWKDTESTFLDFLNVRWVATEPGVTAQRLRMVYDGIDGRIFENPYVLPRFFAVKNAVVVTTGGALAKRLAAHTDWANTAFVEEPVKAGGPASVEVERLGPADFRLNVRAQHEALVVSSQALWPGWRIETDRGALRPIRVNGAFLGFVVPRGTSVVRVRYFPMVIYASFALSAATFAALLAAALRSKHG